MLTVYYQEKTKLVSTSLTKDGRESYKYSFKKFIEQILKYI